MKSHLKLVIGEGVLGIGSVREFRRHCWALAGKWERMRENPGARSAPVPFSHHPKTHRWVAMADEAGTYLLCFIFCTFSDPFSSLQALLSKTTEVIIFLRIPLPSVRVSQYPRDSWWHLFSLPAHHAFPLPSASPSIHSQPTPVVEKCRVERVHPIP